MEGSKGTAVGSVIWGILILIYVIPALGVPASALAGYVGVKMTKKEKNK